MNKTPDNTAILRITMPDVDPVPWREVEVRPVSYTHLTLPTTVIV